MSARGGWDLRILSWNICELRGDLPALIDGVRDLDADVLLLQEAPRFVLPQARLSWFASRVDRRILVGGRGGRGLAILAREEIAGQVIRRGMHPVAQQLSNANSTYPRGVAAVRLAVPGGGAVVVSDIHFALQVPNRERHARHVLRLVQGAGAPVIVGGDLNEGADGPARTLLSGVLEDPAASDPAWDQPTFPAASPRSRIDALLTTPDVRVRAAFSPRQSARVSAERFAEASDHLPVVLDVRVPRA